MVRLQRQNLKDQEMKVNIYGAGGHAKVVIDNIESIGWEVNYVYDDNTKLKSFLNFNFKGKPVFNDIAQNYIIAIGCNHTRKKISLERKLNYVNAIHKNAVISRYAKIGIGNAIMSNVIVNSASILGDHCILNTNSVVEHDCKLSNFVHLSSSSVLTGGVSLGEGTFIGAGAVVLPGVSIGKWCVIGAGSVITKDIPDNSKVIGVPGKIINN